MGKGQCVEIAPKWMFKKEFSYELIDLCLRMIMQTPSYKRISSIEALFAKYFESEQKEAMKNLFPQINKSNYFSNLIERFGSIKSMDLILEIESKIEKNPNLDHIDLIGSSNKNLEEHVQGMIAIEYLKLFYLEEVKNEIYESNELDEKYSRKKLEIICSNKNYIPISYKCLAFEIAIFKKNKMEIEQIKNSLGQFEQLPNAIMKLEDVLFLRAKISYQYYFNQSNNSLVENELFIKNYIYPKNIMDKLYLTIGRTSEAARTLNLIGMFLKKNHIWGRITLNFFKSSEQMFSKLQGYTQNLEAKVFINLFEFYFGICNFGKALINLKLAIDYLLCFKNLYSKENSKLINLIHKMRIMNNLLSLYIISVSKEINLDDESYKKKYSSTFLDDIKILDNIEQIDLKNRRAILYCNSTNITAGKNEFKELINLSSKYCCENGFKSGSDSNQNNNISSNNIKSGNKYSFITQILKMNLTNSLFLIEDYNRVYVNILEINENFNFNQQNPFNILTLPLHYCYFNLWSLSIINISYSTWLNKIQEKIKLNYSSFIFIKHFTFLSCFAEKIEFINKRSQFIPENLMNIPKVEEDFFDFSATVLRLRYCTITYYLMKKYKEAREEFDKLFSLEKENQFCQPSIRLYSTYIGFNIYKKNNIPYDSLKRITLDCIQKIDITLQQSQKHEINYLTKSHHIRNKERNSDFANLKQIRATLCKY